MNWPTSQDYNEAIQNPATSFSDPSLKGGAVVVNAIGLPVPRSGNFADVYQFNGGDGKTWALKCFTRRVAGLQERYAKIDEHIGKANFPFTVGFKYLADGIRVRGQWHPLLKMEWVEGFTLNEFIRDNAGNPQYLHALMQMWGKLTARLRDGNFAHADLQHGNVLLVPGDAQNKLGLKLIDYDGMWIPTLAEYHSGEIGHPNFQHPLRLKERLYNADVDRFPHVVIACALRATVVGGRSLWDKFDNGDNLLFKESDLRDPAKSPVFKELWSLNDDALCALVGKLALAAKEPLRKTPWLDDILSDDGGLRLNNAQEKSVMELLSVGPHFTSAATANAGASPATQTAIFSEFIDNDAVDDEADQKAVARRTERNKKPAKSKRRGKSSSLLPYYLGGGVLVVALIAGVLAMKGGGKKSDSTQPEGVAKSDVVEKKAKSLALPEKKNSEKPKIVETPPKKDPVEQPIIEAPKKDPIELTKKEPVEPPKTDFVEPAKDAPMPPPRMDWDQFVFSTNTTKQDDYVRLRGGSSNVATKQLYSGDVDITAVARTNRLNIRFYAFNGGCVIFNWELKPDQLRVHRPDRNNQLSIATAPLKPLAPDTWYTLRWLLTKNGMKVFVDGELIFEEKRAYDLSTPSPINIRTNGSIVDVKSFVVTPWTPMR